MSSEVVDDHDESGDEKHRTGTAASSSTVHEYKV